MPTIIIIAVISITAALLFYTTAGLVELGEQAA